MVIESDSKKSVDYQEVIRREHIILKATQSSRFFLHSEICSELDKAK
jgi:hypothetical protein